MLTFIRFERSVKLNMNEQTIRKFMNKPFRDVEKESRNDHLEKIKRG